MTFTENKPEINEIERKVLQVLYDVTDSFGEYCISFAWISDDSKLNRKEVQVACRALKSKGLVMFYRGLMSEEGQVAGSGYCISQKGKAYICPCDVCGQEAIFDYDGKKECQEHYKQSTVQPHPSEDKELKV